MSQQEVAQLAEMEVTHFDLYQSSEDRTPVKGGVLDRRLGTTDKIAECETCGGKSVDCSGHMGYIRLVLPVFHVGYFKQTVQILQDICKASQRKSSKADLRRPAHEYF